jgi:hypothetical protein
VHVLVDEHLLVSLDAAAHEAHQVRVLQLGDQLDLRLEFHQALHGARREPLDPDLGSVGQLTLLHRTEAALAELVLVKEVGGGVGDLVQLVQRELGVALLHLPELEHLLQFHGHGRHADPP